MVVTLSPMSTLMRLVLLAKASRSMVATVYVVVVPLSECETVLGISMPVPVKPDARPLTLTVFVPLTT